MDDCKDSQKPTDRADALLQKAPLNESWENLRRAQEL